MCCRVPARCFTVLLCRPRAELFEAVDVVGVCGVVAAPIDLEASLTAVKTTDTGPVKACWRGVVKAPFKHDALWWRGFGMSKTQSSDHSSSRESVNAGVLGTSRRIAHARWTRCSGFSFGPLWSVGSNRARRFTSSDQNQECQMPVFHMRTFVRVAALLGTCSGFSVLNSWS